MTGLQAAPVWNVSLVDLVFRDAAPTFLDRHDVPSQGDWALVHTATVVAKGTEGFLMKGCLVTRPTARGCCSRVTTATQCCYRTSLS